MKILDKSKSLYNHINDFTNGLGKIQPLSCIVTEELNGIYECEFTVLTTDKHYNDLIENGLFAVEVGNGGSQIFRIYYVSIPIDFVVTIKAQHISYDLSKVVVKPFTATGAVSIKNGLILNMLGDYPFDTWTNITNTTSTFKLDIPRSFRECLGGWEGSVLDVLRCEYEWDNLTVKMYARRGSDNGVRIAYGKNLTDFVQEQNNENVYDGTYGYAVVDEVTYEASNYYNKTGATTPRILNVDFSSDYESGDVPTAAELLQKATTYATNNSIEVPSVNIKIDFIPLWQTEEYKNILQLERVSLGDTVHVYFDKLNVEASSRVIKTVWNVLTEKYDSIELGDARANMNTVINETVKQTVDNMDIDLDVDVGWLEDKLDTVTNLIANGLGLHISQDSVGRIILHNAETISASQYQYMITSSGFQLSEDYGQTWSSGWTTSGDAVLNSLSTITLRALEIYGSYIEGTQIMFGDSNDKYILARPYDADNDGTVDGILFEGTGYATFKPQEQFFVDNVDSNGNSLNSFKLGTYLDTNDVVYNEIDLVNMYYNGNYEANSLQLISNATRNRTYIRNRKRDDSGTANYVMLTQTGSTSSEIQLFNYSYNTTYAGNAIYMQSTPSGNTLRLANYQVGTNSTGNSLNLTSDMRAVLWSGNDLWLRSNGAVRIYTDINDSTVIGDWNSNDNGNHQDLYLGGYSVKIQAQYNGKIYLYWGGTRYYLGVSNGVVTATSA